MEDLLDQTQLRSAADVGCLQSVGTLATATVGHHGPRRPQGHGVGLALEDIRADVLEGDCGMREEAGGFIDPDLAGGGDGLDAGGGVDRVAGNHALGDSADGDGDLAGDDADPHVEPGDAGFVAQGVDGVDDLQPGPNGPLGVVLVGDGDSPDGHDGVADELLHRAAVALHDSAAGVEVAGEELADVLLVAALREGREPDEVTEEDRGDAPFGDRLR